ncbi:MAG: Ldh family oxidoreductase [Gemmatimonadota bacterium]|nr:Ldh family oxidoreductase [Gemmatimonadota bacterium]
MNVVPVEFIRVMPEDMRKFMSEMYCRVGMSADRARLMAELLVDTDIRGVFSHGTRQSARYLRLLRDGDLNQNPDSSIVHQTPATGTIDGDGGLGHFACWRAAHLAVEKAAAVGLAAVATRNHFHFGAAGKYSRVISGAGMVGFVVSSHVRQLSPDQGIMSANGASPMSFAVPSGREHPLVLDMSTAVAHSRNADFETIFHRMPATFFKSLGLGAVCHALGGLLAGIQTLDEEGASWTAVNQGSFILAVDVSAFAPRETFQRQMDDFVTAVRGLQPFPGEDRALLPGALEWEREQSWASEGIPVGPDHRRDLAAVAAELGVETPFQDRAERTG